MKEGDLIPDIILRSVSADGTKNFGLHDNLKFKRTLIICAPGAFTSTCHIQHLPPFVNGTKQLMSEKKIDLICCMTTNDPYVLELWRKELGDSKILFLSEKKILTKIKLSQQPFPGLLLQHVFTNLVSFLYIVISI